MIKLNEEQQKKLLGCVGKESLFYGQPELQAIIKNPNQIDSLCAYEIYDWINSLYWGESLGIRYAIKMIEITKDETWTNVLKDELDHQKRISDWILETGLVVSEPNFLLKKGLQLVVQAECAKSLDELKEAIQWGQLFLEELGTIMSKWRLPTITDRGLKAIIYKIFKDERSHIATGQKVLNKLGINNLSRFEIMNTEIRSIFPTHIANELLTKSEYEEIKNISINVTSRIFQDLKTNFKLYRPISIIQTWEKSSGYHCFVCSPTRSEGLQLEPKLSDDQQSVFDTIIFSKRFEGLNGLIHGGFISMILDEAMCYAPILIKNRIVVTTKLNVEFLKPIRTNNKYIVRAKIDKINFPFLDVSGQIEDTTTGQILVRSTATVYNPNPIVAAKILPESLEHPELREMLSE